MYGEVEANMLDGVPISVANLTAPGVLMVILFSLFLALMKGWVVVKAHYDEMVKSRDYWRQSCDNKDETIKNLSEAVGQHNASAETIVKVMGVLQDAKASNDGGSS